MPNRWLMIEDRDSILESLNYYQWMDDPQFRLPPSLRPAWIRAYLEAYPNDGAFALEVHIANQSCLLLMRRSGSEINTIYERTADYWGAMYSHPGHEQIIGSSSHYLADALTEMRTSGITSINLEQISRRSTTLKSLKVAGIKAGYIAAERPEDNLPYIKIQEGEISNWLGVNSLMVDEYKHKLQKLLASKRIAFITNPDSPMQSRVLAEAREAQILRWRHRGSRSNWEAEERNNFIRKLVKYSSASGTLRLFVLLIDGEFAAMRLAFAGGDTIYDWATAFSARFKRHSPGAILLLLALEECVNWGTIQNYDLLRGTESWKFDWTTRWRETDTLQLSASEPGLKH
jgi:Acetyltransferase (GNAT) domain